MQFSRWGLLLALCGATPVLAQSNAPKINWLDDEAERGGFDVTAHVTSLPATFSLVHQSNGDGYSLEFTPNAVRLNLTQHGTTKILANAVFKTTTPAFDVVAQRRGPRWRILVAGQTVLEAENDAFAEGQIGATDNAQNTRVQPIEDIAFDDDFMRIASDVALRDALKNPRLGIRVSTAEITESIWSALDGKWQTTGLTENAEAQVAQSANPFAFRPLAQGKNSAIAGRAFWSDYSTAVSIEPQGAHEVGVLAYVQDAKNYLGFFWSDKGDPQLRAVVNGVPRVLGAAKNFGSFDQNQWYRMKLAVASGTIRGFIDDAEVVRGQSGLFGRGQVGLYADLPVAGDDKSGTGAAFDDAQVRSLSDFHDDYRRTVPGRWINTVGTWNIGQGVAKPADARGSYAVMGEGDWSDYHVAGDLKVPQNGATGLLMRHRTGEGTYLFRVAGSKSPIAAGRLQIALIAKGKTKILAETNIGTNYDNTQNRWEFQSERGYLSVHQGDKLLLDAYDETLPAGRAGIYAQNGGEVRNFSVEFPVTRATWAKVPDLYEVDQQAETMGGWSTPQGFWVAQKSGDSTSWEHKGRFWGDTDVRFALPDLSKGQTAQLALSDDATLKFSADKVVIQSAKLSDQAAVTLAAGAPIEVAQRGNFVIVRSADKAILWSKVS